jgi:hypothetical protein
MAGREFDKSIVAGDVKAGVINRLDSRASGRLSGDQFCVYVANQMPEQLALFKSGQLTLETDDEIHRRVRDHFAVASSRKDAFEVERAFRDGSLPRKRPRLNPA